MKSKLSPLAWLYFLAVEKAFKPLDFVLEFAVNLVDRLDFSNVSLQVAEQVLPLLRHLVSRLP